MGLPDIEQLFTPCPNAAEAGADSPLFSGTGGCHGAES